MRSMLAPPPLADRRILVTGASADSAIGRAICGTLAGQGARLVLVGRRPDALEETRLGLAEPGRHLAAPCDLADLDAIPAWMKGLATAGGPFHGVVHSASVQGYTALRAVTQAQIERYFTLNVGAALLLARGLRQRGVAATPAAMVFIGSAAGLSGQKGRTLYAASKAALVSLTRSLALELADRPIRVNSVAPAIVRGARADEQFAMLSAEQNAALAAAHPLGYGEPGDVAEAVAFLLGDGSRRITGVTLPVDGGFTAG